MLELDNSFLILSEYAKKDNRVVIIEKNNKGVSSTRNIGLKYASGEVISFMDSDDWVHSRYFEILLTNLNVYDSDVAVCSYCRTSDFDIDMTNADVEISNVQLFSREENLNHYTIKSYIWGILYRSECLQDKFFVEDINISEDKAFNVLVFSSLPNIKVSYVNVALYFYYNRADSIVNNTNGLKLRKLSKYYLEQVEKNISNNYSAKICLKEAFTNSLNIRYLTMFSNDVVILAEIDNYLINCAKYQRKYRLFKSLDSVKFWILYKFPIVYRAIRIYTDRTMLEWERNEKKREKMRKTVSLNS